MCSIDRVAARVQRRLRELAAGPGPGSERLRQMLIERVLIRIDSVQAYSQGLDDLLASLRPAYMARRSRYFEVETAEFVRVLIDGRRAKEFTLSDARTTAQSLLLATNSLLPYSLSVRELGERTEIAKKIERLADLLLHGLLRRSHAGS